MKLFKTRFAILALLSILVPVPPGSAAGSAGRASERSVTSRQASRIALRTVQRRTGRRGFVSDITRENDFGARWEVEVTLRNGVEFDVYVNRRGRVVRVVRSGRD